MGSILLVKPKALTYRKKSLEQVCMSSFLKIKHFFIANQLRQDFTPFQKYNDILWISLAV